jgi:outer membrane putative beta-barrel porin/alpha-amylase
VGVSVTVAPPAGQYKPKQLVNLGYHRWALKPEIGISRPLGRWTLESYAGVWLFTANDAYFPGNSRRQQDPIFSLQGHAISTLPHRAWLAFDGTWFAGGQSTVDGIPNPDLQRNSRFGVAWSIPVSGRHSVKLSYSAGATTRRGTAFDTVNVTWQFVRF